MYQPFASAASARSPLSPFVFFISVLIGLGLTGLHR